jgi:sulfatase maturation enzyme AslB (radical SAM superfamily)
MQSALRKVLRWGAVGWCHGDPRPHSKSELARDVVERLMGEVAPSHPYFILHGGEALLYSRFGDISTLLKSYRCFAITCTNGTYLERFQDVAANNPFITYLISLDGPPDQNDRLRGAGIYAKVSGNIEKLRSVRRPPCVGVRFTMRPENVHIMYDFCVRMASLGVDWVLLNPCWFCSPARRSFTRNLYSGISALRRAAIGRT